MKLYLSLAALAAALTLGGGGVWYVLDLRADKAALTSSVAALEREAAVAKDIAEQANLARAVADAEADRLRAKAAEYDDIQEWILRSDDDAPLPDLLRATLDRLLGRGPR